MNRCLGAMTALKRDGTVLIPASLVNVLKGNRYWHYVHMEWSPSRKSTVATQNVRMCWLAPCFSACFYQMIPPAARFAPHSFTNKSRFHHGEHPPSSPLATTAQPTPFQPWLTAGVLLSGLILIYPGNGFLCRIRDLHQSESMCIIRNKPAFSKKVDQ